MLLVFIYCGSDWRAEPGFVVWANSLGPSSGASFVRWFASHLTIFTNAGDGLVRQIRHNVRGHGPEGTYLLGRIARSFWYYFPIATTIKMSPLFLLLPIAIAVRSPGALTVWPNLIAAGLFLLSPAYRVQIGIRLILPILSFAAAGIGASAALAIERGTRVTRFAIAAILAVGLLLNTAQLVSLWPDALVYSNSFWGGSRNGYRYLSDSNYDWGQGLPELREWQRTHPDVPMDVWYFGVDPALLSMAARNINLDLARGQSLPNLSRGHYLAASISFLFGASQSPEYDRTAEFLGTQRPIA